LFKFIKQQKTRFKLKKSIFKRKTKLKHFKTTKKTKDIFFFS